MTAMVGDSGARALRAARKHPTARAIAEKLTPDEAGLLCWWTFTYKRQSGSCWTNSAAMESLHQKKLVWSPFWLPATAPNWMFRDIRLAKAWSAISRNRWTWRLTRLFHNPSQFGPTKLGKRVAAMFVRADAPNAAPPSPRTYP